MVVSWRSSANAASARAPWLEAFLAEQSWVARKVAPWFREVGVTLEAIRVGYRGAETSFSARIPTDHLARLLSYLDPLAKRRPFALFIDELQDLKDRLPGRQGDALLGLLRSELQRLSIPIFYAGSGRESFRALFMESRSPFYESAPMLEVPTIPADDLCEFIVDQFRRSKKRIDPMLADGIVALGGESPNDVQHLAHEVFAATPGSTVETASVGLALDKILADLTPTLSVMWTGLTVRQQRVLLTVALAENLGASTTEFMRLAGVTSHAAVAAALKTLVAGTNPLVEKTGSKYRIRHRYVQLWLVHARSYVEQHIPALRDPDVYATALARVVPNFARLMPIPPPGG